MIKKKKLIWVVIIALLILVGIFFFPKSSYQWGSGIGTTLDCQCLGFNKVSSNFIGGGSKTCFGQIYNCQSDTDLALENKKYFHKKIIDKKNDSIVKDLDICDNYRYSNCPVGCLEMCVSSHREGRMTTADCNGEGSCVAPENIGWIKYQNNQFNYEFYYPSEWKDYLTTKVMGESTYYYLPAYKNPENKNLGLMSGILVCIGRKSIDQWDKDFKRVENSEQPTMGDEITRTNNYVYYQCPQFEAFVFTVNPNPYKLNFNIKKTFKLIN